MTSKEALEQLINAYNWLIEEGELRSEEERLVLTLKMTTPFHNDEQKSNSQKK